MEQCSKKKSLVTIRKWLETSKYQQIEPLVNKSNFKKVNGQKCLPYTNVKRKSTSRKRCGGPPWLHPQNTSYIPLSTTICSQSRSVTDKLYSLYCTVKDVLFTTHNSTDQSTRRQLSRHSCSCTSVTAYSLQILPSCSELISKQQRDQISPTTVILEQESVIEQNKNNPSLIVVDYTFKLRVTFFEAYLDIRCIFLEVINVHRIKRSLEDEYLVCKHRSYADSFSASLASIDSKQCCKKCSNNRSKHTKSTQTQQRYPNDASLAIKLKKEQETIGDNISVVENPKPTCIDEKLEQNTENDVTLTRLDNGDTTSEQQWFRSSITSNVEVCLIQDNQVPNQTMFPVHPPQYPIFYNPYCFSINYLGKRRLPYTPMFLPCSLPPVPIGAGDCVTLDLSPLIEKNAINSHESMKTTDSNSKNITAQDHQLSDISAADRVKISLPLSTSDSLSISPLNAVKNGTNFELNQSECASNRSSLSARSQQKTDKSINFSLKSKESATDTRILNFDCRNCLIECYHNDEHPSTPAKQTVYFLSNKNNNAVVSSLWSNPKFFKKEAWSILKLTEQRKQDS
ncbi:unnamed protein product [Didymodactylos carnosus]|uniref:Uncharacterized protein n=1 Tax=Didymodactylos carnosus TaxID=1234261 RepID=A0A813YRN9_9BILA|nr:unnamed protein product [Didymodactylos carnosus]CAF3672951.1 unnamed protein product [Didymodactylos carnosus]